MLNYIVYLIKKCTLINLIEETVRSNKTYNYKSG